MTAWQVCNDVLVFEGLRMRLHRIARTHWRPADVLRSWRAAPLHADHGTLHAPCADDEALWLGAWLDDPAHTPIRVTLVELAAARRADIVVPAQFQIAALTDPEGLAHPLVRSASPLTLTLHAQAADAQARLVLSDPGAWSTLAARPPPDALTGPPPRPPRLG